MDGSKIVLVEPPGRLKAAAFQQRVGDADSGGGLELACAELENLKKLSGEKTDAKAIRFAIQNYVTLNDCQKHGDTDRQCLTP